MNRRPFFRLLPTECIQKSEPACASHPMHLEVLQKSTIRRILTVSILLGPASGKESVPKTQGTLIRS